MTIVHLARWPEKAELASRGGQWVTGGLLLLMGVMTVVAALRPSE